MYFILNEEQTKVLYFYNTYTELCTFKEYNFVYRTANDLKGLWGFQSEKTKYYFVGYKSFQEEDYKKVYSIPPKGVRVCTKYLISEHRKRIIKKLLEI